MATSKNKPEGRVRRVASAATDFVIDEVQNVLASTRNAIDIGRRSVQRARKPAKEMARDTAARTTRAVTKAVTRRKTTKRKPKSTRRNVSVTVKSSRTKRARPKRARITRRTTRTKVNV
jgi:hypothetical protein